MQFSSLGIFFLAACFYSGALAASVGGYRRMPRVLLGAGLWLNLVFLGGRYRHAWPMTPLHEGAFFMPFFFGCAAAIVLFNGRREQKIAAVSGMALLMLSVFAWTGVFFPRDYYLPFLQTRTIFAHLFFLFGAAGKGCFFMVAAYAVVLLPICRQAEDSAGAALLRPMHRWTVLSFALWTLSIFSGALWSYLGWGSPVVWDDPAIATAMGTWMLFSLLLHLPLTKLRSASGRAFAALGGALWILIFNWLPELGQWSFPKLL